MSKEELEYITALEQRLKPLRWLWALLVGAFLLGTYVHSLASSVKDHEGRLSTVEKAYLDVHDFIVGYRAKYGDK